ncbi:MAG TPA: hypothetical protein VNA25_07780 [Phycisphaerae bacterium]|nr:hypothetical protein [Phycisphaerae bacterium]
MCPTNQYEKICKDEFGAIKSKLNQIDSAIRGNGRPGIHNRLERLERMAILWSRLMWVIASSVVILVVSAVWKLVFNG